MLETLLYQNAESFVQTLLGPEPPNDYWINKIIESGILNKQSPKTVWAAKRLLEICNSHTQTSKQFVRQ